MNDWPSVVAVAHGVPRMRLRYLGLHPLEGSRERTPREGRLKIVVVTAEQQNLLEAIRQYVGDHGYPPTLRHLAAQFHVSVSTIHRHLGVLQDAGMIRRAAHSPRAIEIVE